jgi:hypothetical protein
MAAIIAGCHESELTKFNEAPTARITQPLPDAEQPEGKLFTAQGQVGDEDDPVEDLLVTWYKGDEFGPQCIDMAPADNGQTRCDFALGAENQNITLEVMDPSGKETWDVITVVSIPAQGPVVTIESPLDGAEYREGETISLLGNVQDEEDVESALVAWWANEQGTVLIDQEEVDVPDNGEISNVIDDLSPGGHMLRLFCSDTTGRTNYAGVTVEILAPPTASITGPPNGTTFDEDAIVLFMGRVGDANDMPSALSVSWSSSTIGVLDTTPADDNGDINFATDALSVGNHVITLLVTDTHGDTASAMSTIEISATEGDTGD